VIESGTSSCEGADPTKFFPSVSVEFHVGAAQNQRTLRCSGQPVALPSHFPFPSLLPLVLIMSEHLLGKSFRFRPRSRPGFVCSAQLRRPHLSPAYHNIDGSAVGTVERCDESRTVCRTSQRSPTDEVVIAVRLDFDPLRADVNSEGDVLRLPRAASERSARTADRARGRSGRGSRAQRHPRADRTSSGGRGWTSGSGRS
jgi:hypothetical protein